MSQTTRRANEENGVARSYLPAFASQENRQLDEDVRKLELQLREADAEIKGTNQRVQGMAEHLQDVQSELKYMHQRYDGKKKELETEDHLKKISSREQVMPNNLNCCCACIQHPFAWGMHKTWLSLLTKTFDSHSVLSSHLLGPHSSWKC